MFKVLVYFLLAVSLKLSYTLKIQCIKGKRNQRENCQSHATRNTKKNNNNNKKKTTRMSVKKCRVTKVYEMKAGS